MQFNASAKGNYDNPVSSNHQAPSRENSVGKKNTEGMMDREQTLANNTSEQQTYIN